MTDIFRKLNYKNQDPILVLSSPRSFQGELREMAKLTAIHTAPKKERDMDLPWHLHR